MLFVYCFFASVLPVWLLLQPRDYINSQQLMVALALLLGGHWRGGPHGRGRPGHQRPGDRANGRWPADAPPIWPFLFITIACGAISGFHCLVAQRHHQQADRERVRRPVCRLRRDAARRGAGRDRDPGLLRRGGHGYVRATSSSRQRPSRHRFAGSGDPAVQLRAAPGQRGPRAHRPGGLGRPLRPGRWLEQLQTRPDGRLVRRRGGQLPDGCRPALEAGRGHHAVLVACFAATTLDTATRLQRYVVQELAASDCAFARSPTSTRPRCLPSCWPWCWQ